jgi:hypothetical protein
MSSVPGVTIETKVTRSVDVPAALDKIIRRHFTRIMMAGHKIAAQPGRVPIDKGYLRKSMDPGGGVTRVGGDASSGYFVAIGTNLDYGTYLEDKDARGYHYVGGPSAGSLTQGWLSRSIVDIEPLIPPMLDTMASELEAAWTGGGA